MGEVEAAFRESVDQLFVAAEIGEFHPLGHDRFCLDTIIGDHQSDLLESIYQVLAFLRNEKSVNEVRNLCVSFQRCCFHYLLLIRTF